VGPNEPAEIELNVNLLSQNRKRVALSSSSSTSSTSSSSSSTSSLTLFAEPQHDTNEFVYQVTALSEQDATDVVINVEIVAPADGVTVGDVIVGG